jgi:hypothetical protein
MNMEDAGHVISRVPEPAMLNFRKCGAPGCERRAVWLRTLGLDWFLTDGVQIFGPVCHTHLITKVGTEEGWRFLVGDGPAFRQMRSDIFKAMCDAVVAEQAIEGHPMEFADVVIEAVFDRNGDVIEYVTRRKE